ncbi:fibronectin type III domain-containing protein, partial [Elusimicrobiota bacterium]
EAPTSIYIDELSTTSITISAYASTFTNLSLSNSGINIAKDGAYAGWSGGIADSWATKAPPPTHRAAVTGSAVGGKIYVFGGYDSGYLAANEEYDPATNTWVTRAPMPAARDAMTSAVVGGKIYVIGGWNNSGSRLVANDEYDPGTNTWLARAPMLTPRNLLTSSVIGDKIYVIGGFNNDIRLAVNEEYDPGTNTWVTRAPMLTARDGIDSSSFGGKIYVIGGWDGSNYLTANEEYDPGTNTWVSRNPMPTGRNVLAAPVSGGKIYALGGSAGTDIATNEEYDPVANTWVTKTPMPTARSWIASAVVGSKIYLLGGTGVKKKTEEYNPGFSGRFTDLTINTQYTFSVKARNQHGVETSEISISSYTAVNPPVSAGTTFPNVYATSMIVTWGANNNPATAEYYLHASTSSVFDGAGDLTYGWEADIVSTSVTNLSVYTTYYFKVAARNSDFIETVYLNLGSTRTTNTDLQNINITDVFTSSITVSWDALAGPEKFILEASTTNFDGTDTVVSSETANISVTTVTVLNPALSPNTTYFLRVGTLWADTTYYSGTLSTCTRIETPTSIHVDVLSTTSVTVSVDTSTFTNLSFLGSGINFAIDSVYAGWSTGTFREFTGLDINTQRTFSVKARNQHGIETPEISISSYAAVNPPALAGTIFSDVYITSATATWDANSNPGTAEYYLHVSTSNMFDGASDLTFGWEANMVSTAVTGLSNNATFYFQVAARNSDFVETDYLNLGSTITLADIPVAEDLADVSTVSVTANWNKNNNPDGTIYEAEISSDPVFGYSGDITSTTINTYAVFGNAGEGADLIQETTYYLRVRAINYGLVQTIYVSLSSTITFPMVPDAPMLSGAAQGVSSITWTWNDVSRESGYRIISKTDENKSSDLEIDATSWTEISLSTNTAYSRRAVVFNVSGFSTSTLVTKYTLAAPPTGLTLTEVNLSSISVSWQANDNPSGTSYRTQIWKEGEVPVISTLTQTSTTFINLDSGSTYFLTLGAVNGDDLVTPSEIIITTSTVVGSPVGLSGTGLGASSISWTWSSVTGAVSYKVYSSSSGSLLSSPDPASFIQTGLLTNKGYGIKISAVGLSGEGNLSDGVTAYTLTNVPSGLTVVSVSTYSIALDWEANDNPSYTPYEVSLSLDGFDAHFSTPIVFGDNWIQSSATIAFGLSPGATYHIRIRSRNLGELPSNFCDAVSTRTVPISLALPPSNFTATALEGRRIELEWDISPSTRASYYDIYYDSGTGVIDYIVCLASISHPSNQFSTQALEAGVTYRFGIRVTDIYGVKGENTSVVASATAIEGFTPAQVRAAIRIPKSGRKITGNRVLVMAEIIQGSSSGISQVEFQYRLALSTSGPWTQISAANINHPNPDLASPYFVHWDVTGLANDNYALRAVAKDLGANADPSPSSVNITIDHVNPEIRERKVGNSLEKQELIFNTVPQTIEVADEVEEATVMVIVPAGAVNSSSTSITVVTEPSNVPAPSPGQTLESAGKAIDVTLGSGQTQLNTPATITIGYEDADNDGLVDGTLIRGDKLAIHYYDQSQSRWSKDSNSAVNKSNKTVTVQTSHFSLFGLFAPLAGNLSNVFVYPVPYIPNDSHADNGKPYNPADSDSGIIFDNLTPSVKIEIFTVTGELVKRITSDNSSGKINWDAQNSSGQEVASGVYIVVIKDKNSGNKVVRKIAIIR